MTEIHIRNYQQERPRETRRNVGSRLKLRALAAQADEAEQQNEAPIPGQFHATEKRHFSMHADARGNLIQYILCAVI